MRGRMRTYVVMLVILVRLLIGWAGLVVTLVILSPPPTVMIVPFESLACKEQKPDIIHLSLRVLVCSH